MQKTVTLLFIITGIIHILPLSGVLGAERLAALYGLSFNEPNLAIMMRHRAVLFGLLGVFMIYAAFRPDLQLLGLIAGGVSVVPFIAIALSVGGYNDAIRRVVLADWVALASLVGAGVCLWLLRRG